MTLEQQSLLDQPTPLDPVAKHIQDLVLSWSRVSTYLQCGEKYRLSYIADAERRPQGPFIGGIAVHEAIEAAERGGHCEDREWVSNRFQTEFTATMRRIAPDPSLIRWGGRKTKDHPNGEDEAWWRAVGPMMMRRYVLTREEDRESGISLVPSTIEARLRTETPAGRAWQGVFDAFAFADSDGAMVIRDWKTGVYTPDAMQLASYALLAKKVWGWTVERGEYIMLRRQDAAKRRIQLDLRPYIDLIFPLFEQVERGISAGAFPITPSNMCVSCSVVSSCSYGQALAKATEADPS